MTSTIQIVSQWSVVTADVVPSPSWEPGPLSRRADALELRDMLIRQLDDMFDLKETVPLSTILRRQIGRSVQILLHSTEQDLDARDISRKINPAEDDKKTTWHQRMAKDAIDETTARMVKEIDFAMKLSGLGTLEIKEKRYLETSNGEHIDIGWAYLDTKPWTIKLAEHHGRECCFGFVVGVKPFPLVR